MANWNHFVDPDPGRSHLHTSKNVWLATWRSGSVVWIFADGSVSFIKEKSMDNLSSMIYG